MKGLTRISLNSIRFKLIAGLILITLPTVLLLIYNNLYAIRVVHNQVGDYSRSLVLMYMEQIDNQLNDIDKYLTNLIVNDKDLQDIGYRLDEQERILAKVRLDNKLSGDIATYRPVNSIFVYSIKGEEYIEAFQDFDNSTDRDEARGYIRRLIAEQVNKEQLAYRHWYVEQIDNQFYLFRILRTSDAFVGAWLSMDKLSVPLSLLNLGNSGTSLFVRDNGEPLTNSEVVDKYNVDLKHDLEDYYLSGTSESFLVVGQKSAKGNFSLLALIPNDQILENLPYLRRLSYAIPIAAIILVPACLLIFRRMFLKPLNRILVAMRRIGEGNLNTRIESYPTSDEFHLVNATFNQMIKQVQDLRIHVYEEQLNKQKAELQHLQLQINPHFFINSLNIIYNLALVRNFELIQEMTLSLVQYFRYMFRSNLEFVMLSDELKHVRNYIRIQQLRFPSRLEFKLEAPDYLLSTPVPPLIIQTFVENAIKHAANAENTLSIAIVIDLLEHAKEPLLQAVITDTGSGFPDEILRQLEAGKRIQDEQGDHIGIWNAKERLRLLYENKATIALSNDRNNGAVVELLLPLYPNNLKGE